MIKRIDGNSVTFDGFKSQYVDNNTPVIIRNGCIESWFKKPSSNENIQWSSSSFINLLGPEYKLNNVFVCNLNQIMFVCAASHR